MSKMITILSCRVSAIAAASVLYIAGSTFCPGQAPSSSAPKASAPTQVTAIRVSSPYQPNRFPKRAGMFYGDVWGVDSLTVKATESGELIRFSYRVLNASKAAPLNDKKSQPKLVDPQAGVELVIPSLEKVGQLRQSSIPVDGKVYWMAFSNVGRRVKKGDHVEVHIGSFRAQGLVVD